MIDRTFKSATNNFYSHLINIPSSSLTSLLPKLLPKKLLKAFPGLVIFQTFLANYQHIQHTRRTSVRHTSRAHCLRLFYPLQNGHFGRKRKLFVAHGILTANWNSRQLLSRRLLPARECVWSQNVYDQSCVCWMMNVKHDIIFGKQLNYPSTQSIKHLIDVCDMMN